jgi:tetratricopeptide (TPR) repeat protein
MKKTIVSAVALLAAAAASSVYASEGLLSYGTTSAPATAALDEALSYVDGIAPWEKIRPAAEKAIAADANLAMAHYLVGTTFWGDQGKAHMEKATALSAKSPEGERRFIEAALLQRARKFDEAVAALETLHKDFPRDPLVAIQLADAAQAGGKLDRAREVLKTALELAPKSARAHLLMGGVLVRQGEYAKGRASLEMARANVTPGSAPIPVWFGISHSYVYEGKHAQAVGVLRQFIDKYKGAPIPGLPEVFIYNSMARIQLEGGDPETALATYEKGFTAVADAKDLPDQQKKIWSGRLHHGRGRALARMGRHKEAWKEAEIVKARIDAGGDAGKQFVPAYHYLAGYLKLEAGDTKAALEHLKQAEEDDPFQQLLLAQAYEKAGDKENARATYQKIVDSKQNNLERALAYPKAKKKLS